MTRSRFVALPPEHVASSRLAWRIARAIVTRGRGWSLLEISVWRRWRFQVGSSRWMAQAYVSFFRGAAVYAIHFEGKGSVSALESSALVQDLRARLGTYRAFDAGSRLVWKLSDDSRPRRLLAELDRIAQAFGANDRHPVPSSRSRTPGKRLAVVAEAVLAHGTWNFDTPSLWIRRDDAVCGAISPTPSSDRGRPELHSVLCFSDRSESVTAAVARAGSRGYVDGSSLAHLPAPRKLQPLSLRAALAEARFIEAEVHGAGVTPEDARATRRPARTARRR